MLVISSSEWPVSALRAALDDDVDELRVVVPAVHQSRLEWLTNADDDARERADEAASSIAEALPSQETEASAGDSDPLLAAEDALREFPADEVVVVSRPDEEASWLEEGSLEGIAQRLGWPQGHSPRGERQRLTAATRLGEDVYEARVSIATNAFSSSRSSSRP